MYHKATLFNDAQAASAILKTGHPRKVKTLGRTVRNYDDAAWMREREGIVQRGNYAKFTYAVPSGGEDAADESGETSWRLGNGAEAHVVRARSFREALLQTGDRDLVEASPFDRIWGIGFKGADAEANRENWGLNLLGKALEVVREQFREEARMNDGGNLEAV